MLMRVEKDQRVELMRLEIPACAACVRHLERRDAGALSAVGWVVGGAAAAANAFFLLGYFFREARGADAAAWTLAAEVAAGGAVAGLALWLRRRLEQRRLGPPHRQGGCPVVFESFELGSVWGDGELRLRIDDEAYADAFLRLNPRAQVDSEEGFTPMSQSHVNSSA
jgi:hypothetical protein